MSNNQKFLGGLILGAAAGAALALFFSSDKGKEVVENAKNKLQDLRNELDKIIAKANVVVDEMEAKISEV